MPGAYLHGFDETTGERVMCRVTSDGKLIVNAASILENPPTEDEALKAATSEWAYDHWKNANAHHTATAAGDLNHQDLANRSTDDHHTKFTAADARAAINDLIASNGRLTKTLYCEYQRIENLMKFALKYSSGSSHYCSIRAFTNSPDVGFQGRHIGVDYPNTRLRLWNGAAYKYVQTDDQVAASITTHKNITSAHHAKYTDAEALAAPSNNTLLLTTGTYVAQSVDGKGIVYLNSAGGDIQIDGLADGYDGQIIQFFRTSFTNNIILIDRSVAGGVDEIINTYTRGDETQAAGTFGGFVMHHLAGAWYVNKDIT